MNTRTGPSMTDHATAPPPAVTRSRPSPARPARGPRAPGPHTARTSPAPARPGAARRAPVPAPPAACTSVLAPRRLRVPDPTPSKSRLGEVGNTPSLPHEKTDSSEDLRKRTGEPGTAPA